MIDEKAIPEKAICEKTSYETVINETMLKRNEKDAMKSCADYVPSHEKLTAFSKSDKWFNLAEYIEFFCDPVYVELESEKAWPVQKFEKITGYLNEE